MRLVMVKNQVVYGKAMHAGESFDAPDNEARTWIKLGWAREQFEHERRGPGRPRKQQAVQEASSYNRRDMRAEDE